MRPNARYDFRAQARDVRRALLVTAAFEQKLPNGTFKNVLLSDQMRRVLELINELSFGAEPPSAFALFRSRAAMARALSMDPSDLRMQLEKVKEFGVVEIVEEAGFLQIELRAAKLAVAGRALEARAAIEEIEIAQRERVQQMRLQLDLPGCEKSHDQARDYGYESALDEAEEEEARERLAGLSRAQTDQGSLPGSGASHHGRVPGPIRGVSPDDQGSLPGSPLSRGAHADPRGDSLKSVPTPNRNESGAVGGGGGPAAAPRPDRRFRDGHKNHVFAELAALDAKGELQDEKCRNTWVGRIRDEAPAIDEAIGEVRDRQRCGEAIRSPLGSVFTSARKYVRALGRELRSILFT
jgi:hypothetical protein